MEAYGENSHIVTPDKSLLLSASEDSQVVFSLILVAIFLPGQPSYHSNQVLVLSTKTFCVVSRARDAALSVCQVLPVIEFFY